MARKLLILASREPIPDRLLAESIRRTVGGGRHAGRIIQRLHEPLPLAVHDAADQLHGELGVLQARLLERAYGAAQWILGVHHRGKADWLMSCPGRACSPLAKA